MKGILSNFFSITVLYCCILFSMLSCEKAATEQGALCEQVKAPDVPITDVFSVIPANLAAYNLLSLTKSTTGEDSSDNCESGLFCLDSNILWQQEEQLYLNNSQILYRQIPINLGENGIYCTLSGISPFKTAPDTALSDSMTLVKSYLIIKENILHGKQEEFAVTMLPQYNCVKYNELCTYLNKPNYSGLIIYSNRDGNFQKIEHYRNGLILQGDILTYEDLSNEEKHAGANTITYLTLYKPVASQTNPPLTKTGDDDDIAWDDELSEVVVIATNPSKENSFIDDTDSGGAGSGIIDIPIEDGRGGGGGNSSSGSNEEDIHYSVAISHNGNGVTTGSGRYAANSSVTLTAIASSNYIFGGWVENGDIVSSNSSYSFTISSNRAFTAPFYSRNSECDELYKKYKNNQGLKSSIDLLNSLKTQNNSIEYGVFKTLSGTTGYIEGNARSTKIPFSNGIYEYFIHNHPNNALIPSIDDIYGMYMGYQSGVFDIGTPFMIQTYYGCMSIEIEDITKFKNFIENVLFLYGETESVFLTEFSDIFDEVILGSPNKSNIHSYIYTERAIAYYLQHGLKIAHTYGIGDDFSWAYAKLSEATLYYIDCLE